MHPAPDSSAGFAAVQHHLYDAQGERGLKGLGTITEFYVNGETKGYGASLGNYVRYVSGYFVVDGHGRVSKHYYAGAERVVSRLAGDVAGYLEAEDLEGEQLSTLRSRQQRDVQAAIKTWDLQIFPFLNYPKPTDNCSLYPSGSEEHKQCVCDQQNTCTEVLYWYHPDHLGSSTFLSDAAGEPYQFGLYLPFGELFAEQRAAEWSTPYLFNAKELDNETGLYYYGARYYDPRVSTWWGVDPLAGKAPGWTPYRYGFNNPIRFIDPNGMFEDDPIYNKQGKEIGNDGKTDGKAYVVQGKTARDVKRATKAGEYYTGSLAESRNVMKVPTGGVMDDVISSVEATASSQREHGGHSMFGDVNATRWDEGPAVEFSIDEDGTKSLRASITPFRVAGKRVNVNVSNVEFWWHTHPKTEAGGIQLGSSYPSGSDYSFQGDMQKFGFKGNTFVIGLRDQKVSFYNKDRVVLRMNYELFKQIGKQ